jgi:hypothetical protein
MQKLLKNHFPYQFLFVLLPLFFVQCEGKKEVKTEYKNKLKYFRDQYGIEKFISEDNKSGVYISLPECFRNEYSSISIKNEHNFYCYGNEIYFSIDPIEKSNMGYYVSYFSDNRTKNKDDLSILRDYVIATRSNSLIDAQKSVYSNIKTNENKLMYLGSVKGYSSKYEKELFYQFGVIADGETYYILQSILSADNTPFLHQDIIEIFKSFRIN